MPSLSSPLLESVAGFIRPSCNRHSFIRHAGLGAAQHFLYALISSLGAAVLVATASAAQPVSDGPATELLPPQLLGDAAAGRDVFRFETFGNEGFWTDAARLLQGIADAKLTPMQALMAGIQVDSEAIDPVMRDALAKELKTDLLPKNAPMLNDPAVAVKLVEANAIIGMVPVHADGSRMAPMKIGPGGPDKVGISCALCHTITDNSVFALRNGGSIGRRLDGRAGTALNVGKLLSLAANSRVFYPIVHADLGPGHSVGRGSKPLSSNSTEAEFDAYLTNPKFFPIGTFDDTPDGNGNPVLIPAFFRQDLAAPYGSNGQLTKLDDFNNQVYTLLLDPTTLVTPEGRELLKTLAGPSGEKLADEYQKILTATGVTGYPYVKARKMGKPGDAAAVGGFRVDEKKLLDLNAYLASLPAPKGAQVDATILARGREIFRANCTTCHNVDQSKPVPPMVVEMKTIWPGYKPKVAAQRPAPLSPIQDSPGIFDDKVIVVDASGRGEKRGMALPLLLDLARRSVFLHDGSVRGGLDELLDPKRGQTAPHPFYIKEKAQRKDVIDFLRSLDAGP